MLAMEEVGLHFRATKDLDIVLCIEVLNEKFVKTFWKFIKKVIININKKVQERSCSIDKDLGIKNIYFDSVMENLNQIYDL
jgi:hypothetical protein